MWLQRERWVREKRSEKWGKTDEKREEKRKRRKCTLRNGKTFLTHYGHMPKEILIDENEQFLSLIVSRDPLSYQSPPASPVKTFKSGVVWDASTGKIYSFKVVEKTREKVITGCKWQCLRRHNLDDDLTEFRPSSLTQLFISPFYFVFLDNSVRGSFQVTNIYTTKYPINMYIRWILV